jgi:hypothetical protein
MIGRKFFKWSEVASCDVSDAINEWCVTEDVFYDDIINISESELGFSIWYKFY